MGWLCHRISQKSFYTIQTRKTSSQGSYLQVGIRQTSLLYGASVLNIKTEQASFLIGWTAVTMVTEEEFASIAYLTTAAPSVDQLCYHKFFIRSVLVALSVANVEIWKTSPILRARTFSYNSRNPEWELLLLSLQEIWNYRWKGNSSNYNNGIKQNSVELTSLVKMALNMQQQITISAWAIMYANDREAARRARREFNIALQPSTVGKWRKRLLETGRMQKIKPPGRPRTSTDAETTERIVEAFDASPQSAKCWTWTMFIPAGWCASSLCNCGEGNFGWSFAKQVGGKKRPHWMASPLPWPHSMWLLVVGLSEGEGFYARKPQDIDMLKLVIEEEIRAIPLNMYNNAMTFQSVANYAWM